jgi:flagellar biosynthesis/type III secretory pathway chaperone
MDKVTLIDLERRELDTLNEFLDALKTERDAIISFSLEGIVRENNRKEEILKRLEYVEGERAKLASSLTASRSPVEMKAVGSIREMIDEKTKELRVALEKNMGLLSFSVDHVKTSIEKIIEFVNRSSYDKGRSISVMVSRKV